jgi:hypothetical protein
MDEYDSAVKLTSTHTFEFGESDPDDKYEVEVVNISQDSVIRMDMQSVEANKGTYDYGTSKVSFYSNKLMTKELASAKCVVGNAGSPNSAIKYIVLPKGTYYMKVSGSLSTVGSPAGYTITTDVYLTAIAVKDAFSVTAKKATGNSYDLVFHSNMGNDEKILVCYCKGDWTYTDNVSGLRSTNSSTTCRVNEAGSYTVTFTIGKETKYDIEENNTVLVKNVYADKVKPKVSGVKNGATYKKAVTVKFSDAETGVKSATLNGKKIKSGKKVSAKGSYTLIVTDKAGNKKTVKFKIKK